MADAFLSLPVEDRSEALRVAADRSGRPVHLLEKDVWVVWALATLFGSDIGAHLVFKGAPPCPRPMADLALFRGRGGAFVRILFATHAGLWRGAMLWRIRESGPLTLLVSRLVWVWSMSRKPNIYNAKSNQLTIEWE